MFFHELQQLADLIEFGLPITIQLEVQHQSRAMPVDMMGPTGPIQPKSEPFRQVA